MEAVVLLMLLKRIFILFFYAFTARLLFVYRGHGAGSLEAFTHLLPIIVHPILHKSRLDVHVPHVNLRFLACSSERSLLLLVVVGLDSMVLVAHDKVVGGEAAALDVGVEEHQVGVAQPG